MIKWDASLGIPVVSHPLYRNTKTLQKRNGRKDYTIRVALKITFGATNFILNNQITVQLIHHRLQIPNQLNSSIHPKLRIVPCSIPLLVALHVLMESVQKMFLQQL